MGPGCGEYGWQLYIDIKIIIIIIIIITMMAKRVGGSVLYQIVYTTDPKTPRKHLPIGSSQLHKRGQNTTTAAAAPITPAPTATAAPAPTTTTTTTTTPPAAPSMTAKERKQFESQVKSMRRLIANTLKKRMVYTPGINSLCKSGNKKKEE